MESSDDNEENGGVCLHKPINKDEIIKQVLNHLKEELKKTNDNNYEPERDPTDGLLSRNFMLNLNKLIYKYKKYGLDMLHDNIC